MKIKVVDSTYYSHVNQANVFRCENKTVFPIEDVLLQTPPPTSVLHPVEEGVHISVLVPVAVPGAGVQLFAEVLLDEAQVVGLQGLAVDPGAFTLWLWGRGGEKGSLCCVNNNRCYGPLQRPIDVLTF